MIDITNLNKSFKGEKVLENINLHIKEGEIFGIIGKSGAGKSTLLRCINKLENKDSGSIKVNGGYILTPSANLYAMIKAAEDFGKY